MPPDMPRHIILNPLAVAAEGASRLPSSQRKRIARNNLAAAFALRDDVATHADVARLSHALLMADTLARIAPLARANRHREIAAGIDALAALSRREAQTGRYIATADECKTILEALLVHQVQINHASLSEMEAAQRKIEAMRASQPKSKP